MRKLRYAMIVTIIAGISAVIIYPANAFLAFLTVWLLLIPVVAIGYLMYGLQEYVKNRKNSIVISIKSNEITKKLIELAHNEDEIRKEKEILYKELKNNEFRNNARRGEI